MPAFGARLEEFLRDARFEGARVRVGQGDEAPTLLEIGARAVPEDRVRVAFPVFRRARRAGMVEIWKRQQDGEILGADEVMGAVADEIAALLDRREGAGGSQEPSDR